MKKIIHAKKENIDGLAALFAKGFIRDPLFCHYIPYEEERESILFQIFRKYLNDCWDFLCIFQSEDGEAALCIYPSEEEGNEKMILPPAIQKVYDQIGQSAASEYYKDVYILDLLAVAPQNQGKGYAKALVEAFIEKVQRDEKKGIVEIYNPHNIPFYEKCGFHLAHIHPIGETLTAYLLEV